MLRMLTELFESLGSSPAPAAPDRQHTLQLATAVLLLEVVRADGEIDAAERDAVLEALRSRFDLTPDERADLFELAREKSEHTHDLFSFTARLNQALDEPERIRVFEMLWNVAYADGRGSRLRRASKISTRKGKRNSMPATTAAPAICGVRPCERCLRTPTTRRPARRS
jgi:uncharacterized tellurite resistance protein B-like protein